MSILDTLPTWTWGIHRFARVAGGEIAPWFKRTAIVAIEPILGSSDRYVDLGGTQVEALQLRAVFANVVTRDACLAAVGTPDYLTNIRGDTVLALLKDAQPLTLYDLPAADLTFEAITV